MQCKTLRAIALAAMAALSFATAAQPPALAAASSQGNDAATARLMQDWQQRILVQGLPVADAAHWAKRNLAKFSSLNAEQLQLAQRAATLGELELLLASPPVPEGTRLGLALANPPSNLTLISTPL